jgi:Flp pilus assembly pilin Flp
VKFMMKLLTLNERAIIVLEYGLITALVAVVTIWAQF